MDVVETNSRCQQAKTGCITGILPNTAPASVGGTSKAVCMQQKYLKVLGVNVRFVKSDSSHGAMISSRSYHCGWCLGGPTVATTSSVLAPTLAAKPGDEEAHEFALSIRYRYIFQTRNRASTHLRRLRMYARQTLPPAPHLEHW